jgi:hypothetical protein
MSTRFWVHLVHPVIATAILLALSSLSHSETVFFDDFNDRDAEDGDPVEWVPVPGFPGTFDASSGDYVLAPSERAIVTGVPAFELDDVSIRTQVSVLITKLLLHLSQVFGSK